MTEMKNVKLKCTKCVNSDVENVFTLNKFDFDFYVSS